MNKNVKTVLVPDYHSKQSGWCFNSQINLSFAANEMFKVIVIKNNNKKTLLSGFLFHCGT